MIDSDHGGTITTYELKKMVCTAQKVDEKIWEHMI